MFSPHSVDATNALSLGDARKWLRYRAMQKGSQCPCCGGFTRFYERRINKTMARCLGWLAHISGPDLDWVEVPKKAPRWLLRSNQLATLRHWNLVEKQESVESKGKASGICRQPTPKISAFAMFYVEPAGLSDTHSEQRRKPVIAGKDVRALILSLAHLRQPPHLTLVDAVATKSLAFMGRSWGLRSVYAMPVRCTLTCAGCGFSTRPTILR